MKYNKVRIDRYPSNIVVFGISDEESDCIFSTIPTDGDTISRPSDVPTIQDIYERAEGLLTRKAAKEVVQAIRLNSILNR